MFLYDEAIAAWHFVQRSGPTYASLGALALVGHQPGCCVLSTVGRETEMALEEESPESGAHMSAAVQHTMAPQAAKKPRDRSAPNPNKTGEILAQCEQRSLASDGWWLRRVVPLVP